MINNFIYTKIIRHRVRCVGVRGLLVFEKKNILKKQVWWSETPKFLMVILKILFSGLNVPGKYHLKINVRWSQKRK